MSVGTRIREALPDRTFLVVLLLLAAAALAVLHTPVVTRMQEAGRLNFTMGFLLVAAWAGARVLAGLGLPKLTGYILVGIAAGPHALNVLTADMVQRLSLVDDLALNFIGLAAGGTLQLATLSGKGRTVAAQVVLSVVTVFALVFCFTLFLGPLFAMNKGFSSRQILAMGLLLGVLAVARSPSSAIAVISETKARGPFTQTILGVTVVIDVLIIVLFTVALTVSKMVLFAGTPANLTVFAALLGELAASVAAGVLFGKAVSVYINKSGKDLALFLLFFALGVSKFTQWLAGFTEGRFGVSLYIEPLLLCISAGFFVQNFGRCGEGFMNSLDRFSLPVFLLFFSLAGASLNIEVLPVAWALAVCLVLVRGAGIYAGAWLGGVVSREPPAHRRLMGLGYFTQAGVSIGLAHLAGRQFPEIGMHVATVVLAVIAVNQVFGPVALKAALVRSGETPETKKIAGTARP
ncbi:MAG: cation:proton antiporter [Deltaproteobacteria bacterium]|nr:cation:proton antiporter [Deltaproteobacteria bacterium]